MRVPVITITFTSKQRKAQLKFHYLTRKCHQPQLMERQTLLTGQLEARRKFNDWALIQNLDHLLPGNSVPEKDQEGRDWLGDDRNSRATGKKNQAVGTCGSQEMNRKGRRKKRTRTRRGRRNNRAKTKEEVNVVTMIIFIVYM